MVVALFALSLVMVVGGIAAVIQGFPYVRLESGLAMVIGGSTAASAGVILLGLCAVVVRLKRIEDSLDRVPMGGDLQTSVSALPTAPVLPPMPEFGAAPPVAPPARPDLRPDLRPALAGTAGLAGLGLGGAGLGAGLRGSEPVFEDTPPPPVAPEAAARETVEPLLPDLLPAGEAPSPAVAEARPEPEPAVDAPAVPPEEDLFAQPAADDGAEDSLTLRPSLKDDVADAASEPSEEPEPVAEEAVQPQVVGTYSSGGNTYVMYSTGVIEADTPNGRFTFNSLDELKAFVDSGGENQARGAA